MADARLDPATVQLALDSLLAQHPSAYVAAVGPNGLFVPMPAEITLRGQQVLVARSLLDVVMPSDRVTVITTWEKARAVGAAHTQVRLASEPRRILVLHFFDIPDVDDVFLLMMFGDEVADGELPSTVSGWLPPRLARVRKDGLALFLEVDAALEQILGWRQDELVGRRSLDIVHPDDHERAIASWLEMLTRTGETRRVRLRHQHRNGTWVWFELSNENHLDPSGDGYVETEMLDISDEMAMQEALREREQLLSQLTEALPTGVLQILPDRSVVYANTRLSKIVGLPIATTLAEQLASAVPDDHSKLEDAVDRVLREGANGQIEVRLADPETGELRFTTMTLQALYDADGAVSGALITVADVTESVLLRAELEDRATYDALTRCLNRASIMQMLEGMLAEGKRPGVLFIDVDGFKEINDGLGHNAGDQVLVTLADLMRSHSRNSDAVGRMGGDEFIIVCPHLEPAEAARLRERTMAGVNGLVTLPPGVRSISVSVGVSCTAGPDETADSLVARADSAMYVAKRQHHGEVVGGAQPERRVRKPVVVAAQP